MVAGGFEGIRKVAKNGAAVVFYHGRLAVHQTISPDDFSAERDRQGLMAEADAEKRQTSGEMPDRIDGHSSLVRRAGPRRDDDPVRLQRLDLLDRDLVVAVDADVLTQLSEILHQVVSEGIVVVDHEQHGYIRLFAVSSQHSAQCKNSCSLGQARSRQPSATLFQSLFCQL